MYIISGSIDKTIRVWNLLEKKEEAIIACEENWIKNIEVSSDRKYFYLYSENKILIWNLLSKKQEGFFECNYFPIKKLKVTNDNKYIISISEDHRIGVWNILEKTFIINKDLNASVGTINNKLNVITCSNSDDIQVWDF